MILPPPLARFVRQNPWIGPLFALMLVFSLFAVLAPSTFARPINLITMARQTAVVGIAATGATMVIILGGIDLSVGSAVALTTVLVASVLKTETSAARAIILSLVTLFCVGLANGALTSGLKITPFIVTLGTMSILRGAAKGIAHEQKIDVDAHGIDSLVLPSKGLFGLPLAVWMLVATAVTASFLLHQTRFGRHIFAIGSNERTARLCGVRVGLTKTMVYAIAGLLAGVAGLVEFGTLTVGDPTDSIGLELDVIASVVIGGGSLSGGEGSIPGTLLGALLMTVIKTGCTHVGLSNWVQELVTGGVIIVAVTVDRLRHRRQGA